MFLSKILRDRLSCVQRLHTQKGVYGKENGNKEILRGRREPLIKHEIVWLMQRLSLAAFDDAFSTKQCEKIGKVVETWKKTADALSVDKFYRVSNGLLLELRLSHASKEVLDRNSAMENQ